MVSSGTSTPERRLRSSIARCISQPSAPISGSTSASARKGDMPLRSTIAHTRKAARIARSPCARLMMRMTPNMNDSPQAISA